MLDEDPVDHGEERDRIGEDDAAQATNIQPNEPHHKPHSAQEDDEHYELEEEVRSSILQGIADVDLAGGDDDQDDAQSEEKESEVTVEAMVTMEKDEPTSGETDAPEQDVAGDENPVPR